MGFNPVRTIVAALLIRRNRARAPVALVKLGNEARAHSKPRRDGPDRRTADNILENARTQIKRIWNSQGRTPNQYLP